MKLHFQHLNKQQAFISLIAGMVLPFAFLPVGFYPLAFVCLSVLFWLWSSASALRALWLGFWFGVGLFSVGASWVFVSIHEFGNTNVLLASLFTLLFILVLASLIGGAGFICKYFFPNCRELYAFSAIWVLQEWIRSWLFSGFPWLLVGYSQISSPLAGYVPLLGEYGVGFLVALISGLCVFLLKDKKKWPYGMAVVFIMAFGVILSHIPWAKPSNNHWYSVALLQGNVPQAIKWDADYLDHSLRLYLKMTRENGHKDIIVWPESAIPTAYQYVPGFIQLLSKEATASNSGVIVSAPLQIENSRVFNPHFYNALFVLGEGKGSYYKRHLVPFGEYLPLKKWLHGLIAFFDIPMSDFIPGALNQPNLQVLGIPVAPFICYEIAYGEIVRHNLPEAELLVTTSNDSWFGNSMAPWQHAEIAQFRSLQTGRYQLFVGNSGVTAIINPQGKFAGIIPQFKATSLVGKVQTYQGATPWVKIGNVPIILLLALGIIVNYLLKRTKAHVT